MNLPHEAASAAWAGLGLAGLGLAGLGGATAYAVLSAESQILGRTLVAPPLPQQLALTFDDGPNPSATPRLLAVLARHRVRATFFLIGDFVRQQPALTREIAAAGHVIGNHTQTHPWLPLLSPAAVRTEISTCNNILEETLGRRVELFRPPHGARRPDVLRVAAELGLRTVQWNLIVDDWEPVPAQTILARIERGLAQNRRRNRGTNVVLHDGGQGGLNQPRLPTVEAVNLLLDRLAAGTDFVTPPDWH